MWLTALKRPLVVIHELFSNSVLDLSWSGSGLQLMACSWDGSVAFVEFSEEELGKPLTLEEKVWIWLNFIPNLEPLKHRNFRFIWLGLSYLSIWKSGDINFFMKVCFSLRIYLSYVSFTLSTHFIQPFSIFHNFSFEREEIDENVCPNIFSYVKQNRSATSTSYFLWTLLEMFWPPDGVLLHLTNLKQYVISIKIYEIQNENH